VLNDVTVTVVHDVTGLIHGPAAGGRCLLNISRDLHLLSFLCTIKYMHMVFPNFHIVTVTHRIDDE